MRVMGRELEVPFHLAGGGVERQHGIGVEIVAEAGAALVVGGGVTGAPVDGVGIGIVGSCHPRRAPAGFSGLAGPGGAVGVARLRYGMCPPQAFPGFCIIGVQKTVERAFAGRDPDNDLVTHYQRSMGDGETLLVVIDRDVIDNAAGLRVQGHEMSVEGTQIQTVAQQGEASVGGYRAVGVVFGQGTTIAPDRGAGAGVQRRRVVARACYKHEAIRHDGRVLHAGAAELKGPLGGQFADVGGRDALQGGGVGSLQVAPIVEPVLGFGLRVLQALPGDVEVRGRGPFGEVRGDLARGLQEGHQVVDLSPGQGGARHQRFQVLP